MGIYNIWWYGKRSQYNPNGIAIVKDADSEQEAIAMFHGFVDEVDKNNIMFGLRAFNIDRSRTCAKRLDEAVEIVFHVE